MVPSSRTRRPLVGSTLLALALAVGTVAGAVGRDATPPLPIPVAVVPAVGQVLGVVGSTLGEPDPGPRYDGLDGRRSVHGTAIASRSALAPTPPAHVAKSAPTGSAKDKPASGTYRGRNHVWMPALGIDRSISFYSCSNGSYPGNRVYRWGCGGHNNVYLFGHAHSVFKPLHDAYVRHRLKKGMKLYYADSNGRVHTYKVAWWKLTTATKGTWAYKGQSRPSLTLQTCVGAANQYRLIVRLTEI
jgi:Sortase domain